MGPRETEMGGMEDHGIEQGEHIDAPQPQAPWLATTPSAMARIAALRPGRAGAPDRVGDQPCQSRGAVGFPYAHAHASSHSPNVRPDHAVREVDHRRAQLIGEGEFIGLIEEILGPHFDHKER